MALLDKRTSSDLVKLVIFIVTTVLATGVLVVLIGNLTFEGGRTYKAEFSDATGVVKGDDVRIAGVKVGSVKGVEIKDRTHAEVTFKVFDSATVTKSSTATVRYRDLVGGRYVSISQGVGSTGRLPADSEIPLSRTQSALDLTVLFNGFKPLFAALSPEDINKLSYEVIQVFQGEGGNLQGLLQSTASVTTTLADRDKVIGSLIDNLNSVLVTIGDRDRELSDLIVQFRGLLHGLVADKDQILNSLDSISDLAVQTADLTAGIRQPFVRDVKQLRRLTANLKQGRGEIDRALQVMPIKLRKIGRTATYGSFFNFYLCQFQGNAVLPTGQNLPITFNLGDKQRCNLS